MHYRSCRGWLVGQQFRNLLLPVELSQYSERPTVVSVDFIIRDVLGNYQHSTSTTLCSSLLSLPSHLPSQSTHFAEMTPNEASATSHDPGPPFIEHDIDHASDRYLLKLKSYARALPYSIESNSKIQGLFNFICTRIVQAVQAGDYDPGFLQWDSMLT
jgi:hypothetical protein